MPIARTKGTKMPVRRFPRRTKVVCTIGPASGSLIERLVKGGMNVARLNLSHGTYAEHAAYIAAVRQACRNSLGPVSVLIDIPGMKYRIGEIAGGAVTLSNGAGVTLTGREVAGTETLLPVRPAHFALGVKPGDTVFIADGLLKLRVQSADSGEVQCRVLFGGTVTPGRGVAVPGMPDTGPFVTEELRAHLDFALGQRPDWLALSFVSRADDIREVREIIREKGADVPIIAKIERGRALGELEKIIAASDGVMVARGDLGVDIPLPRVPLVQKEIIRRCNQAGKPVITATQMLESMVSAAEPTRAEVTDVANAIFDGTDAVMLSGETAMGRYPIEALRMMSEIAREVERELPYDLMLDEREKWIERVTSEVIAYAACDTARRVGAAAIIAFTTSGSTARRIAKFRPFEPVLAISPNPRICGSLPLSWGVRPYQAPEPATTDELFALGSRLALELRLARPGDLIVIAAGVPVGLPGTTNMLKVEMVSVK